MFVFYDDEEENQQTHLTPYEEFRAYIVGAILSIVIIGLCVYVGLTI